MNKKVLAGYIMVLFMICVVGTAHGTLMQLDSSGSIVFDDVSNQYWISDLSLFENMTYEQQVSSADSLSYLGLDWRMATGSELNNLWLSNAYFLEFFQANYGSGLYSGRFDAPITTFNGYQKDFVSSSAWNQSDLAHAVGLFGWDGYMIGGDSGTANWFAYDDLSSDRVGAWVTASLPSPEPATLFIFGTGIIGLIALRKKNKQIAG